MATTHLRSLQALELAIRTGSLNDAAAELSITPAALGQRIRTLEDFLDIDLIVRGRKGTRPTPELENVLADLQAAFLCLDRVTEGLHFQRAAAIHIVADLDLAQLWLAPRIQQFRDAQPNIQFCINGEGDVPSRVGSPDIRIERGNQSEGEILFEDYYAPICDPANLFRVGRHDPVDVMEGVALIHVKARAERPSWENWFEQFGMRRSGLDRGQRFRNTRLALEATQNAVGFMICGLSLCEEDLRLGSLVRPFPTKLGIKAATPYRVWTRKSAAVRPQLQRFVNWLHEEGQKTQSYISAQLENPEFER